MLTRRGWLFLLGAGISVVAGRLLAVPELYVVAGVAAGYPLASRWWVRRTRLHLHATREVHPTPVDVVLRRDFPTS